MNRWKYNEFTLSRNEQTYVYYDILNSTKFAYLSLFFSLQSIFGLESCESPEKFSLLRHFSRCFNTFTCVFFPQIEDYFRDHLILMSEFIKTLQRNIISNISHSVNHRFDLYRKNLKNFSKLTKIRLTRMQLLWIYFLVFPSKQFILRIVHNISNFTSKRCMKCYQVEISSALCSMAMNQCLLWVTNSEIVYSIIRTRIFIYHTLRDKWIGTR